MIRGLAQLETFNYLLLLGRKTIIAYNLNVFDEVIIYGS